MTIGVSRMWRVRLVMAVFLFAGLAHEAEAREKPKAQPTRPVAVKPLAGTPMMYFRYSDASDCNVYMNYSYVSEPKFILKALNPAALNAAQMAFLGKFNAAFAAMIARRPDVCHYEGSPYDMNYDQQQSLLRRCQAQEKAMGYSESGWSNGRLPAPTNCISYRDDMPGVVNLVGGTLPQPKISIESWMATAKAGR